MLSPVHVDAIDEHLFESVFLVYPDNKVEEAASLYATWKAQEPEHARFVSRMNDEVLELWPTSRCRPNVRKMCLWHSTWEKEFVYEGCMLHALKFV